MKTKTKIKDLHSLKIAKAELTAEVSYREVNMQIKAQELKESLFDFNKFKNTKNIVVQTLLNHVDVILHHSDTNNVDLFVRKSFSEHLWLWINDSSSFL